MFYSVILNIFIEMIFTFY